MGISDMQRHFKAYGSGELPEFELRRAVRTALEAEPRLSSAVMDLIDSYRKANLIDAGLYSTINSDIADVSGPYLEMTVIRPSGFARHSWNRDGRAANSTDLDATDPMQVTPAMSRSGMATLTSLRAPVSSPAPGAANTGSTTGAAWDGAGPLNEIAAPLYPGCVIRDRFVLLEELGRGGMGVVFKAYDRSRGDVKDRYVAIKVLNEEFKRHPLAVRSLQREARRAQRLAHPNIVGVYDFDRDGGNVFMVMEFLSGRSLEQVLREAGQGGIPLGPALDIIKCLGAALSYAHEQDIVHCDFKPGNAFLNSAGKVKVLDFGIARAAPSLVQKGDATLFDAGQLGAVSPAYASLEMLQRETPDIRDDVYAFACVAYQLLTGTHPYQQIDAAKAFQTGLEPRPVRKLSRGQWRALKQGLAFRRADRCPTIDSLVSQLVAPPGRMKHWIATAAACVGVIAIAAGLVLKWPEIQSWAARAHLPAMASHQQPAGAATSAPAGVATQPANPPVTPSAVLPQTVTESTPSTQSARTAQVADPRSEAPDSELADALSNPQPTAAWLAKVQPLIALRAAAISPADSLVVRARATGVKTFVAAAAQAREHKQFDQAAVLLTAARSFSERAPEIVAESVALDRDESSASRPAAVPVAKGARRAGVEMLQEQFEAQAAAGDVRGATATAGKLTREWPGTAYVSREVPQILTNTYLQLSKLQFAAGKLEESLQTLADGRKKFARSPELKDAQVRYIAVADAYDHMSTAVTLNVESWKQNLAALRSAQGDEFESAAQMLAQTLADRIADHRAANRQSVADKLIEQGKQIFPDYGQILGRGTAGVLPATPIAIDEQ